MNAGQSDAITSIVGWIVLLGFFASFLPVIFGKVRPSELPKGTPLLLMPIASGLALLKQKMVLRRHQRIAAFLQLADDLRMRKKRVDGFLPRRTGS